MYLAYITIISAARSVVSILSVHSAANLYCTTECSPLFHYPGFTGKGYVIAVVCRTPICPEIPKKFQLVLKYPEKNLYWISWNSVKFFNPLSPCGRKMKCLTLPWVAGKPVASLDRGNVLTAVYLFVCYFVNIITHRVMGDFVEIFKID